MKTFLEFWRSLALPSRDASNPALASIRRHLIWMGIAASLLVFGVGGWAYSTEVSGAVVASGQLVVNSYVKKVQHPTGGVVAEIFARDGDKVKQNDLLIRLDDTQTKANLAIVTKSLDELTARQAREEAERDNAESIAFPADLLQRRHDPAVEKIITGEIRQFQVRNTAREGQKGQLRERITQLDQEIAGYQAQVESKVSQIGWISKELAGVNDLWAKDLVPYTRVTTLEREKQRLIGEQGQLVASIAQTKGKITETQLQILQVDQEMRAEVGKDLADIRARIAELVERKVTAEDQLKRVDIRAPQAGIVDQSVVHTVGGVITAQGEPLMLIVPESDALEVEAKVRPQDIDQLFVGQPTTVIFSAFSQRTTPDLNGKVTLVSADVSQDQKTGTTFYTIRVSIPQSEIARLGSRKLIPGMPAEVFVQTEPRTVISYITRPFADQLKRAFRDD
jgi:HlyD family secretion protein